MFSSIHLVDRGAADWGLDIYTDLHFGVAISSSPISEGAPESASLGRVSLVSGFEFLAIMDVRLKNQLAKSHLPNARRIHNRCSER